MLEITKEISTYGLDFVVNKYKLVLKDAGHKILLKYHQIDSSSYKREDACREARGIVLEKGTWKPLSYLFKRFFNYGELGADELDLNTTRVFKKEDGSLIGLYWDYILNEWCVQTSGTPDANSPVGESVFTFRELFLKTLNKDLSLFNKSLVYIFELCTPYNIVVTPHTESYTKVLGIRNMETLEELSFEEVTTECNRIGIEQVESYSFSFEDVLDMAKALPQVEEGYVACDANFKRVKIKNPAYVALHHLKGSITGDEFFTILKKGEIDEFLTLFPEYKNQITECNEFFQEIKKQVNSFVEVLVNSPEYIESDIKESKKNFALWLQTTVKDYPFAGLITSQIFRWFDNGKPNINISDLLESVESSKMNKLYKSKR